MHAVPNRPDASKHQKNADTDHTIQFLPLFIADSSQIISPPVVSRSVRSLSDDDIHLDPRLEVSASIRSSSHHQRRNGDHLLLFLLKKM